MTSLFSLRPAAALTLMLGAAALVALPSPQLPAAQAHEIQAGDLTIVHPRVRMNIPSRPSAGYMVLKNAGAQDDSLTGAHSAAFGRIELHTHTMENGVMKMGQVENIPVPAGGEVALATGGYHLMMFDPTDAFKADEPALVTLTFEHAGDVDVWMLVQPLGAPDDMGDMDHSDMDHGDMDHGDMDHGDMDHDHMEGMDHGDGGQMKMNMGGNN